jgi:lipopolysaccharide export LptBFGC system permease protein LptF
MNGAFDAVEANASNFDSTTMVMMMMMMMMMMIMIMIMMVMMMVMLVLMPFASIHQKAKLNKQQTNAPMI